MKLSKTKTKKENFLILKENESLIVLADKEIKSSIQIFCKNKKLVIRLKESNEKNETIFK